MEELTITVDAEKALKGYKVFNSDWICRGYKFEVGKTFEEDVKPVCCKHGFHFCTELIDCLKYYNFDPKNKVAEVEALGEIDTNKDDSKCCTNKIHIIREISWYEVLEMVNTGSNNTGYSNSGNNNAGNHNSGNYNIGHYNSGNCNTGHCNSGLCNTGNNNAGDYNTGQYNSGNYNSGNYNSGNSNSGCSNAGDYNSGDWNKTCFSNGCFNTESPKIFLFNKLSDWTLEDWRNSDARCILMDCPSNVLSWIWEDDMTDEEKEQHPEYSVTGGFLKHIEKETGRQMWWDGLSDRKKTIVMNLPNFDKDIFKEVTGIEI